MSYALRLFDCADCRRPIQARAAVSAEVRCTSCNIARSARSALELHEHRGEFYQRWQVAYRAGLARREANRAARKAAAAAQQAG